MKKKVSLSYDRTRCFRLAGQVITLKEVGISGYGAVSGETLYSQKKYHDKQVPEAKWKWKNYRNVV